MTGYPADLLDPELDLEADLGVDTVKQAEVFAAVRTPTNSERDDNLKLHDFPTLHHVAGWVHQRTGTPEPAPAPAPVAAAAAAEPAWSPNLSPSETPSDHGDPILATVTAIVADMTGYPADLLDPELDLEADLGVDTVKQAEVFAAVRTHYQLERDDNLKLHDFPTLHHVAGWVHQRTGPPEPAPAPAPVAAAAGGGAGVVTESLTQRDTQ